MEQNSHSIVGKVAKAPCVRLDELDGAIEAFGAGIADPVPAVVKQAGLMAAKHLDHFFDRLQAASHGVVGPGIEEAFRRPRIAVRPELYKRFLDAPCPASLEV